MPVNEFAIPRMELGKQRPIQSMEEARDWERRFIGEIKAGRDPRHAPSRSINVGAQLGDSRRFSTRTGNAASSRRDCEASARSAARSPC
jgi:hypothetical protein